MEISAYIDCYTFVHNIRDVSSTCDFRELTIYKYRYMYCYTIFEALFLLASVPGSLPYACAIFKYDLWTPRNENVRGERLGTRLLFIITYNSACNGWSNNYS